ncbi:helix-turn-helix domain-containing protein [Streptomyces sp. NPDC059544]|uniref:helix-turn-helix domain-containing protein n=1 Tax=Streptomyces sp. NPDC059544 TaxID=3346861 RepID=UPI0036BDE8A0
MSEEKRRARPAVQYGPTAATVSENVKRLREVRNMTIYSLSGALGKVGRPITPSAVAKIEKQQRQVSVDDLMALAAVLRVNPSALLLPLTDDPAAGIEITGVGTVSAADAWDWMDGARPIKVDPADDSTDLLDFDLYARPSRRRRAREVPRLLTQDAGRLLLELAKEGRSGLVINPELPEDEERDDG